MTVVEPGYEYQIETTDLVAYPAGYITIKFEKVGGSSPAPQDGVIDSLEIIEMMINRYEFLVTTAEDDTDTCAINYAMAYKAETIVQVYVEREEGSP